MARPSLLLPIPYPNIGFETQASERVTKLNSSRTETSQCCVWPTIQFRLIEEGVENIAIAVTTNAGGVPGKDRMIQDVEEIKPNLELVAFPLCERHFDGFGQAEIESTQQRRPQGIAPY